MCAVTRQRGLLGGLWCAVLAKAGGKSGRSALTRPTPDGCSSLVRIAVLVDSRLRWAELYRKLPNDGREQWIAAPGESLKLDSLGLELAVDEMYEVAGL